MIDLDFRIRLTLLFTLLFLSFINYFNTPLDYSDAIQCMGLKCRPFSLILNMLSFTFLSGMMICMGILNKSIFIPTYWFVPIVIIGYILIFIDWRNKRIVHPRPGKITPPPEGYIPKNRRIILVMAILLIYTFLFLANFASHKVPVQSEKLSEIIFWNAFGSFKERRGAFMAGWLSFFGIITAVINVYFTEIFHPQKFNLPNSWKI